MASSQLPSSKCLQGRSASLSQEEHPYTQLCLRLSPPHLSFTHISLVCASACHLWITHILWALHGYTLPVEVTLGAYCEDSSSVPKALSLKVLF